ncbi:hypothetical protein [Streptomyces nojiriensis]
MTAADTATTTYFTTCRVDGRSEGLVPPRPRFWWGTPKSLSGTGALTVR